MPGEGQRKRRTAEGGPYAHLSDEELLALKEQTEKEVTKWDNFQMARKIQINSLYGALGNQYFRHYRLDNAEAITLTGQVSIRWIERKVNEFCEQSTEVLKVKTMLSRLILTLSILTWVLLWIPSSPKEPQQKDNRHP